MVLPFCAVVFQDATVAALADAAKAEEAEVDPLAVEGPPREGLGVKRPPLSVRVREQRPRPKGSCGFETPRAQAVVDAPVLTPVRR